MLLILVLEITCCFVDACLKQFLSMSSDTLITLPTVASKVKAIEEVKVYDEDHYSRKMIY